MNHQDFYPTPPTLISKLLAQVSWGTINSALEPSAGRGDLADRVKGRFSTYNHTSTLDVIEIDPDLQHVLRGKGHNVVHDDFLTFTTSKRYDLIIANFPFSDGANHLQAALMLLVETGGTLVCLVNAETIRNQYTRQRTAIGTILHQHDAKIDYISGAFANAERPTDVEVALITVTIPRPERVSVVLDHLQRADGYTAATTGPDAIVDADPVNALIARFALECRIGVRLIEEYQSLTPYLLDRLPDGDGDKYAGPILKLEVKESRYRADMGNDYIRGIRRKYWQALLRHDRFQSRYTSNILEELERQLDRLQECDFTVFAIRQLEQELRAKVTDGVEQAIMDMFATFTDKYAYHDWSKNVHYYNGWRTNKCYRINKKVIVPINGFSSWAWERKRMESYRISKDIADLVKACNYLDGDTTGIPEVTMSNAFRQIEQGASRNLNFHYFTATFYQKGTCHITFTNQRVLDKLNIYGSQRRGWLPPSYGRKRYADLEREEQAVVDAFQGPLDYEMVMDHAAFYLADPATMALTAVV